MFNFNKELKLRISELEKKVAETEKMLINQIKENKSLKWKLENPPKYKVGDKIGDLIITERGFMRMDTIKMAFNPTVVNLIMLNIVKESCGAKKSLEEYIAQNFDSTWIYELANTVTGEKIKRKEIELMLETATAKVSKK